MVASVQIKVSTIEVERYIRRIPRATQRATARGLNKGIRLVRTRSVRAVAAQRAIRQKTIRRETSIESARPRPNRLRAVLRMSGRPIPLREYGARVQGRRGRGNRKRTGPGASPISVVIFKGRRVVVEGAFLGPNGHVFRRRGPGRLPIKKLFGPSLPSAFVKPIVERSMRVVAERRIPGLIEREMFRELRRAS